MAKVPKLKSVEFDTSVRVTRRSLAAGGEIRLSDGTVLALQLRRGRIVGGTARTPLGKRARVLLMKMSSADGGTSDVCAACVCTGDGGCKCVPVPCPTKPPRR